MVYLSHLPAVYLHDMLFWKSQRTPRQICIEIFVEGRILKVNKIDDVSANLGDDAKL